MSVPNLLPDRNSLSVEFLVREGFWEPLNPGNTKKCKMIHPALVPENTKKIPKKYENGIFWGHCRICFFFCAPIQGGGSLVISYASAYDGAQGA